MHESPAVASALTTFFAKNASGDTSTFDEVVSKEEAVLAIGSSVRELVRWPERCPRGVRSRGCSHRSGAHRCLGERGYRLGSGATAIQHPGRSGVSAPLHRGVRARGRLVEADPSARLVPDTRRGSRRASRVVGRRLTKSVRPLLSCTPRACRGRSLLTEPCRSIKVPP